MNLFIKTTLFLFFVFLVHPKTLSHKTKEFQKDSESFIIGRLVANQQSGYGSYGGLLGQYHKKEYQELEAITPEQQNKMWDRQYKLIEKRTSVDESLYFKSYYSHLGLQAHFISFLHQFLPLKVIKLLNLLVLVSLLSLILLWVRECWGKYAFVSALISVLLAHRLVLISQNLYWVYWITFLPMVLNIIVLKKTNISFNSKVANLFAVNFFAIFIITCFRYEFISTTMVAMQIPLIYFLFKKGWGNLRQSITAFLLTSLAGVLGFLVTLFSHFQLVKTRLGGFQQALDVFNGFIYRRIGLGAEVGTSAMVQKSLDVSFFDVFAKYFSFSVLSGVALNAIVIIHILLLVLCFYWRKSKSLYFNHLPLISCIAFLAPMSWFFLAKGHSYIHSSLIPILLYSPYTILLFALLGRCIEVKKGLKTAIPERGKV